MRKIAVVTTSRADYSHLHWVLHDLRQHREVELRLIATGVCSCTRGRTFLSTPTSAAATPTATAAS